MRKILRKVTDVVLGILMLPMVSIMSLMAQTTTPPPQTFTTTIYFDYKYFLSNEGPVTFKPTAPTSAYKSNTSFRRAVVNASHELRTPLTAIKGFVETLETRADEENRPYLEIIRRNTERMIALVEDLLVLSELEERGAKIAKTEVDLKTMAESILKMFEKRAGDKGLVLSLEASPLLPAIQADPGQMEGLLLNLIDNAVKYADKGSVRVRLSARETQMAIEVEDTGPGIAAEHLPHVFERFYVVDKSRSRKLGGTGLGLSIVKHIVLAHKGSVSVKSRLGEGTTFTVLLPL